MAEGPLHTVSFQAAHTNSAPASPIPYHIDQALRGDVGTTRLPSTLSSVCRFLLYFIALINFVGVLWILWKTPIIAVILAVGIAAISLSLAGLFHGIPYLEHRRGAWTPANWALLNLCLAISWTASSIIVAFFLNFHPPSLPVWIGQSLRLHSRPINNIRADLASAHRICEATGNPYHCDWRPRLSYELSQARRELESAAALETQPRHKGSPDPDEDIKWLIGAIAVLILGAIHGLAAYGSPAASETWNAAWREPHSGYQIASSQISKTIANPGDDPDAAKVFRNWIDTSVKLTPDAEPSTKTQEAHARYSKFCDKERARPLDLASFLAKLKAETGKEPAGDRIPGMSVSDGAIA